MIITKREAILGSIKKWNCICANIFDNLMTVQDFCPLCNWAHNLVSSNGTGGAEALVCETCPLTPKCLQVVSPFRRLDELIDGYMELTGDYLESKDFLNSNRDEIIDLCEAMYEQVCSLLPEDDKFHL